MVFSGKFTRSPGSRRSLLLGMGLLVLALMGFSSQSFADSGHTVLSSTSLKFWVNNALWADVHYIVNGGGQQNFRMTHNADNSNTMTITTPAGATVQYNYTIGTSTGASDTAWVTVNMASGSSS